jgi:hypothetical protein
MTKRREADPQRQEAPRPRIWAWRCHSCKARNAAELAPEIQFGFVLEVVCARCRVVQEQLVSPLGVIADWEPEPPEKKPPEKK